MGKVKELDVGAECVVFVVAVAFVVVAVVVVVGEAG